MNESEFELYSVFSDVTGLSRWWWWWQVNCFRNSSPWQLNSYWVRDSE